MNSKWIDGDLFSKFAEEKSKEQESTPAGPRRLDIVWQTPEKGTPERAKVYEGRFLPDKKGNFYFKYYYHMFYSGERWNFLLCSKTWQFDNFCPWCSATQSLYLGNSEDKKMAANYKRKEKFASNFYVVDDPRDAERNEEEKVNKSIKIYEFPGKVESKLKSEVTDTKHGLGPAIFDPGNGGFNFILKVKATRPKDGKTWPDYSDSVFARRPDSLGSDREIQEIMDSRYDLEEYVKGMERTEEEIVNLLKAEMLWDIVKNSWERAKQMTELAGPEEKDIPDWDKELEMGSEEEPVEREKVVEEVVESTDEDLLAELENI
jgi:hypothetical protein